MKKIVLISLGILIYLTGFSQQEAIYSQYMLNPFTINPAISSTEDYIDLQSGYRNQWLQVDGAPRTVYVTGNGTIGKPFYHLRYKAERKNWHGIGFLIQDDRIGPQQRNNFLLAYSYNIGLTNKARLSFGTFVGVKQLKIDDSHWENIEDLSDDFFNSNLNTGLRPEVRFGAVLYKEKDYQIGFSVQNALGNGWNFQSLDEELVLARNDIEANFTAKKVFHISREVKVTPSTLIRVVPGSPVSADINGKFDFFKYYWTGVSLRSSRAFNVFAGLNIKKKYDVTFAYEYSLNPLSQVESGTVEIILGLRLSRRGEVLSPSQFWE